MNKLINITRGICFIMALLLAFTLIATMGIEGIIGGVLMILAALSIILVNTKEKGETNE